MEAESDSYWLSARLKTQYKLTELATQSRKAHRCWAHGKQRVMHWIKQDDSCVHIWFHLYNDQFANIWWSIGKIDITKCLKRKCTTCVMATHSHTSGVETDSVWDYVWNCLPATLHDMSMKYMLYPPHQNTQMLSPKWWVKKPKSLLNFKCQFLTRNYHLAQSAGALTLFVLCKNL